MNNNNNNNNYNYNNTSSSSMSQDDCLICIQEPSLLLDMNHNNNLQDENHHSIFYSSFRMDTNTTVSRTEEDGYNHPHYHPNENDHSSLDNENDDENDSAMNNNNNSKDHYNTAIPYGLSEPRTINRRHNTSHNHTNTHHNNNHQTVPHHHTQQQHYHHNASVSVSSSLNHNNPFAVLEAALVSATTTTTTSTTIECTNDVQQEPSTGSSSSSCDPSSPITYSRTPTVLLMTIPTTTSSSLTVVPVLPPPLLIPPPASIQQQQQQHPQSMNDTRPQHWNGNAVPRTKVRPKSLLLSSIQPLHYNKNLNPSSCSTMKQKRRKSMVTVSTLWKERNSQNSHDKENTEVFHPSQWSFRPRFVASNHTANRNNNNNNIPRRFRNNENDSDDIMNVHLDDDDDKNMGDDGLPNFHNDHDRLYTKTSSVVESIQIHPPNNFSTSFTKKTTTVDDSPFLQRWKMIRNTIQGDMVRLSSGQYPLLRSSRQSNTSSTLVDRNDPRNRAQTVVDVTILLLESTNPKNKDDHLDHNHHLVTYPCYVHNWTNRNTTTMTTNETVSTTATTTTVPTATYCWIVWTRDTIESQNIRPGSQLRIYNAIYIPTPVPTNQNHPCTSSVDESGDTSSESHHHPAGYIVCTQLCEPYVTTKSPALVIPHNHHRIE